MDMLEILDNNKESNFNNINLFKSFSLSFYNLRSCYRLSVISVTVIKERHLRGSKLYKTSKTIKRGVAELRS